ncbi:MAG: hypothetical protein QNJ00_18160 [Woeseiaceae bacterium]|nr:hypothetical protein [Woeseiaceae bacterium]
MRYTIGTLMFALCCCTLLFSAGATAADDSWLKKRRPGSLFVLISSEGCPVTTEEITGLVHGMLARARIKPLKRWESDEITMIVDLMCLASGDDKFVFKLDVALARLERESRDEVVVSRRPVDDFGAFGRGTPERVRETLESSVDAALMKYLQANFDLDL